MLRKLTWSIFFLVFISVAGYAQSKNNLYEKARQQYYADHYELALKSINEYLSKGLTVDGLYLEYMIYEALGDKMQAIAALTRLIGLDPAHVDAWFKRGELYFNEGIYKQALKDFDHIINFEGLTSTNAIYFKVDPYGQEQVEVTSLASTKAQVYSFRGLTYQAMGEYDKGLQDLDLAIKLDSSAQNFVNRALLYKEINDVAKSREDLRNAVSIDPDLVLAWFNLLTIEPDLRVPEHILTNTTFIPLISYQAVEALQHNDLDLAQSLFTRALRVNPRDPLLLVNAGRLSYRLDRYADAIKFHHRALEVDPGYFEVYYLIGNAYFQLAEFNQAAAYYEQYLARDRSDPSIWYNTALTYRELDDRARACECLSNAVSRGIAIDPNSSLLKDCQQ